MAASNGALSTTSDDAVNGVDGQGGGCVLRWSGAVGKNYAPSTGGHGPVHSEIECGKHLLVMVVMASLKSSIYRYCWNLYLRFTTDGPMLVI